MVLVGARDHQPTLTLKSTLTLSGAQSQLGNLIVKADLEANAAGVVVSSADVRVFDLRITGAKATALAINCAGCGVAPIRLDRVTLENSGVGLTVSGSGANVVMTGGSVTGNGGSSLTGGMGVVVSGGANVTIDGAKVESNEGPGIVIDGSGTKAQIKGASIANNTSRGVWAQGLEGTLDAPALRIENTEIVKNRITGMGAVTSRGIIIVGGRIAETIKAPASTNLASSDLIGDGIGVFDGSYDVKIEETAIESNERAAGVIDGASDRGIIIVGGRIGAAASGLKLVVQNSEKGRVTIADGDKTATEKPLAISAPKLVLPAF